MAKHRKDGVEWWCLPGGGQEPNESLRQGVLRELKEECNVDGRIVRQTSDWSYAPGEHTTSYLVEIGNQEPLLGFDPEFSREQQFLADVKWMRLAEIPERDRVFLWAAGLLGSGDFMAEIEQWGDSTSYLGEEHSDKENKTRGEI